MLQVLFDCGWINPEIGNPLKYYTVLGRKDLYGMIIPNTSLKQMMLSQPDFMCEETQLQYYGQLLGVSINQTPKCHPELAGKGIKYAWTCAKVQY